MANEYSEYVENDICPECHKKSEYAYGMLKTIDGVVYRVVTCIKCGRTFGEWYQMGGIVKGK